MAGPPRHSTSLVSVWYPPRRQPNLFRVNDSAPAPDWLQRLAIETFNDRTLAGLALGVVGDGAPTRFVGLGRADADAGRAIDAGTVFRIASISKTMTAIAVMQLVEESRLSLDDPIGEHLRSARVQPPAGAPPVTARHLLTHSAGIGEVREWRDLVRPVIGLAARTGEPPPDLAAYYRRGVRAEVAAGTKWAYANHGFALLGCSWRSCAARRSPRSCANGSSRPSAWSTPTSSAAIACATGSRSATGCGADG